ncbi:MAG TPA: dTDP-4-dehydrorhamnose 3,5-epimerase [Flavobacteriales bacterium]|nr:dTDP-4-dehydrorhamnose 3,5-epimerase [Flavobacteriales bacterium]
MKFVETKISGVFEIELFHVKDERGSFTKSFHKSLFKTNKLEYKFDESFFSINKKGVIRGMHFQNPPHDQAKLVYVTSGVILDVILDLRKSSPTYRQYAKVEISAENSKAVYMPVGVAHGFCCLTDATMIYLTTTEYNAKSETGILWNSFGMKWPVQNPILSPRDKSFLPFGKFQTPFE